MTTRRTLLAAFAAGAAGAPIATLLAGCEPGARTADPDGVRLIADVAGGLTVVDRAGLAVVPPTAGVLSPDHSRLATVSGVIDTRTGASLSTGVGAAGLRPRIISPDGRLVGLASPSSPRERTTITVRPAQGEATTLELAGNLEPEAFSTDGGYVYVLDYLPPTAPDRYRVRQLRVATGELLPLNTRLKSAVPPGAEEEMRGEGRQAVYDPTRRLLFTLYTHQPDHVHTRDLVSGARNGAGHVHAFVHTLNLTEGWAYCVDLPAPFGEHPAAGHAIALAPESTLVAVVDATTGTAATIDPTSLSVTKTFRFGPLPPSSGTASIAFGRLWELAVAVGNTVAVINPGTGVMTARWSVPATIRGMVIVDDSAYLGGEEAVTVHELTTGRQAARVPLPALTHLLHALPQR